MSEPAIPPHPPEFRQLCEQAVEGFRALPAAELSRRGALAAELRELLARIEGRLEELDLRTPAFADEQGLVLNAASALQSIDLDRGGPHVARLAERAAADLRRVADGPA
ncbi:MAG TPA: hypothetical protein VFR81_13560 [Longimicrobium sp.]|nr:hypothetical protein [Longimicrobium sp.]